MLSSPIFNRLPFMCFFMLMSTTVSISLVMCCLFDLQVVLSYSQCCERYFSPINSSFQQYMMSKCNSRLYKDLDIILKTGIGQSITGRWGKRFETTFNCVNRRKRFGRNFRSTKISFSLWTNLRSLWLIIPINMLNMLPIIVYEMHHLSSRPCGLHITPYSQHLTSHYTNLKCPKSRILQQIRDITYT